MWRNQINGLVQGRRNSIANALELRLSCTWVVRRCFSDLGYRFRDPASSITWSNSLIIGIYPCQCRDMFTCLLHTKNIFCIVSLASGQSNGVSAVTPKVKLLENVASKSHQILTPEQREITIDLSTPNKNVSSQWNANINAATNKEKNIIHWFINM